MNLVHGRGEQQHETQTRILELQDQIELGCKHQLQTEPNCLLHEEDSLRALPWTRSLLIMFQNESKLTRQETQCAEKERQRIQTQVSESCMNCVTPGQQLVDEPGTYVAIASCDTHLAPFAHIFSLSERRQQAGRIQLATCNCNQKS